MNKVALYLRLSDENRDKLTEDELSESIKNQELMLMEYANSQEWKVVGFYNEEDRIRKNILVRKIYII